MRAVLTGSDRDRGDPLLVERRGVDAAVDHDASRTELQRARDSTGELDDRRVLSELHRGRDAIRAFYKAAAGTITMKCTGPVRVAGNEAATPLVVLIGPEGQQQALDIISAMVFDDKGKITSMRAFWSMDAMRPATPED